MIRLPAVLLSAGVAVSLLAGTAFAQTEPPAEANAETAAPAAPAQADRKALAKECSKQADAKGLRGNPRKRFRDACKRGQTNEAPKPVS
jgi:invasion protein IalB